MAKYRIVHERDKCIACGVCASVCPDNWQIGEDGMGEPVRTELEDISCNMDAAQACPSNCIHIYEVEDGPEKELI